MADTFGIRGRLEIGSSQIPNAAAATTSQKAALQAVAPRVVARPARQQQYRQTPINFVLTVWLREED
ncbi:hypothetical protein SOVF_190670 [Spinacia oleracea]|nr:hypothetical protein SOVF_190670 [Spinacia oleracea]